MRAIVLVSALLLSACAGRPQQVPVVDPPPIGQSPEIRSDLIGLTAGELVQRFGVPALQIREGASLKLQFRGRGCVLDAYLYPPVQGAGAERVTHIDTRLRSGANTDQAGCIALLQGA